MLSTAISDIDRAARQAELERLRRSEGRDALRRAEAYLATVEDMVEDDLPAVPAALFDEIARFVRAHSRRLGRSLCRERGDSPTAVLDVLFELEERVQRRRSDLLEAA